MPSDLPPLNLHRLSSSALERCRMTTVHELAEAKLALSGLSLSDPLGFSTVDAAWLQAGGITELRAGFVIPYHRPDGSPSGFFRVRHLESPTGFAAAVDPKAIRRYSQRPGTLNEAYLPPLIDWASWLSDPSRQLIITEGELKSACATKLGFPTIGLGGVDCWQSLKRGVGLVPPLDKVIWARRTVVLVYDSDIISNVNVQGAAARFCRSLTLEHGAKVFVLALPEGANGEKQGLDDFLMASGAEAFAAMLLNLQSKQSKAVDHHLYQVLHGMNEAFAYVPSIKGVVRLSDGLSLLTEDFCQAYAPMRRLRSYLKANGQAATEWFETPREWLRWSGRHTLEGLTYRPGAPRLTDDQRFNTWPGWGCAPADAEHPLGLTPWYQLLNHLFNHDTAEVAWFERWLACPIQHPGTKLHVAVTLWGVHHGTGKSLVGYTMKELYGRNFVEIGTAELHADDNEWADSKQFVMGDDITGSDKRRDSDRLKRVITQEEVRINIKFKPKYALPNLCNFYFTANSPFAHYLEDHDRRHYIHEVVNPPLSDEFYATYKHWLETGGARDLLTHLLAVDLDGFNPKAPAPRTRAKEDMIYLSRSEAEAWAVDLMDDPSTLLDKAPGLKGRAWLTTKELDALWRQHGPATGVSISGRRLGAYLTQHGAFRREVKAKAWKGVLYLLRDIHALARLPDAELARLVLDGLPTATVKY